MTDPLEVLVPPGSLLAELRAARDRELAPVADLETSLTRSIAGPAWSEAISIVERYTKPMAGLDAENLTRLRDSLPCLPGERHTFDAGAKACLCGALTVGIVSSLPTACLYAPAEVVRGVHEALDAIADQVRELENVHGLGGHVDAVRRSEVLELLDTKPRDDA